MQLIFGISADGRTYPDHAGADRGALNHAVVGPAGLIEALEAQFGLLGPVVPKAVRIAAYLAKLRTVGDGKFWSASFSKDAWSTAALLLSWRDALVAGGWTGMPPGAARPDELAAVEQAGAPLPPGLADRLTTVLAAIGNRPGLHLERLTLIEPRIRLAPPWRRLVDAIEATGVPIQECSVTPSAVPASDVARIQTALSGATPEPLQGDGSFTLVEADTAIMAAEAVADWLAAGSKEELAGTVVLAPDGDTALLDLSLAARGLPALGLSIPSAWRGALQVLPLAFAVAWRPFAPKTLLNLLMLPRSPIGSLAAGRLARALVAEPGLDGPAWTRAWEDIAALLLEREGDTDSAEGERKVSYQLARWRDWTAGGQFDRLQGMSAADARQIAGRVATWAMAADAGKDDRLFLAVAAAAGGFVRAIDTMGQDRLPALLIERVLGDVLAEGVANPEHVAQAGGLRAVHAPGALWAPVPRLVWWNFVGPGEKVALIPWSRAELAAWATVGVELETTPNAARRIGAGYTDALMRVTERVVLVRPTLSGADETVAHPLAHQLYPFTEPAGERVRWRAERLLSEAASRLAGRVLARQPVDLIVAPVGRAIWSVPAAALVRLEERRESATTLGRLLNCQLSWFAQDVLHLRPGRFAEIPGADQLFGNLAHEIAKRLLLPGPPPPLTNIRTEAAALFEELLPQIAAPLQQPELAGELAAARERVPAALEALVRMLHNRGLEVVGAELDREGMVNGLPLLGRLDLLVRRGSTSAVVDLKWTRSVRRYRDEITDGRAVQLAVYGAIADPDGATMASSGYFLLRQRRLFAERGSLLADEDIEAARDQASTLRDVVTDWGTWRSLLDQGTVIAAGVGETAALRPAGLVFEASKDPCKFCDLTGLCRVRVEAV
jgi:ATP-dependent helicase/nuclease subunit B